MDLAIVLVVVAVLVIVQLRRRGSRLQRADNAPTKGDRKRS